MGCLFAKQTMQLFMVNTILEIATNDCLFYATVEKSSLKEMEKIRIGIKPSLHRTFISFRLMGYNDEFLNLNECNIQHLKLIIKKPSEFIRYTC